MSYKPTDTLKDSEVFREFQQVASELQELRRMLVTFREPFKPRDGQFIIPDGVTWNPLGDGLKRPIWFDKDAGVWKAFAVEGAGGASSLDELDDVTVPSPADGDVLTYDVGMGQWISSAPSAGASALDDLTDVNAPTPLDQDVLTYDTGSGEWIAQAPSTPSSTANVTPDTHPTSANAMDDEFEAGSLDSKWAWRNQGGASISFSDGAAIILAPNSASIQQRIIEQAAPAGAWKIRCKVNQWIATGNYTRTGLCVIRSASSKMLAVDTAYSTGFKHEANSWNVAGSYIGGISSGGTGSINFLGDAWMPMYLEIEYDGSSVYTFRVSKTGHEGTFFVIGTEAQATNLGGAADKVGIYVNVEGSAGDSRGAFDWFRRIS